MDGDRVAWYEGNTDPLSGARELKFDPDQTPDPRQFGKRLELATEVEITIQDPVKILMECERLDEEQSAEQGTNFNEYIQTHSTTR